MAETITDPQYFPPPPSVADGGIPTGGGWAGFLKMDRPKIRVTSEYDSEGSDFFNKISCKLLDSFVKLKLNFRNNSKGEVSEPNVFLTSKFFSLQYDVVESDALLKASFEIIPGLQFRAAHEVKDKLGRQIGKVSKIEGLYVINSDINNVVFCNKVSENIWHHRLGYTARNKPSILAQKFSLDSDKNVRNPCCYISHLAKQKKPSFSHSTTSVKAFDLVHSDIWEPCKNKTIKARQGEVAFVKDLAGPAYQLELSSAVPSIGLPRATLKFPLGEVTLEEKEEEVEEEPKRALSVNGIIKSHILNGVCTAQYSEETLDLRYAYKDEQMTFIPSISLPSNVASFAFKRRFSPSDKLSYLYHFDTNNWSTVYKHTVGKDYKFKAGYDAGVQLGWASIWVGDEDGKTKTAPVKMKVQVMLQVPQGDIKSSALMFRVKKRWDI